MAVTKLGAGAPQSQSATPQRNDKEKGSGFTNIQKVIGANEGNKLGSAVSSGLQQTGQNVQQSVDRAKERFGKSLEQGALGEQQAQERQGLLDKAKRGEEISADDSGRFGRMSSGQYTGDSGLQNAQGLQAKAGQAENLAQGVNTQGGRYGLLQQFVGSPKYNQGAMRTDALLLGQDAGQVRQAASDLRGTTRGVDTAVRGAASQADLARAETMGFGESTKNMLGTETSTINDPILRDQKEAQDRFPQAQKDMGALNANLEKLLRGGGTEFAEYGGPKDLAKLGIDNSELENMKSQYQTLMGSGFDSQQASDILKGTLQQNLADQGTLANKGSFMDQQQAAQLNALTKLGGGQAQDFTNLGGFKGEGVDLTKGSSVSGLADARLKQQGLQNESNRMQHYVTNFKAANANALNGTNQEDRAYFSSQNPMLAQMYPELDKLRSIKNPTKEQNRITQKLVAKIATEQSRGADIGRDKIAQQNQQAGEYGNLNSLEAYQNYINKGTRGGKAGIF